MALFSVCKRRRRRDWAAKGSDGSGWVSSDGVAEAGPVVKGGGGDEEWGRSSIAGTCADSTMPGSGVAGEVRRDCGGSGSGTIFFAF
jgi:hypothetical protein